MAHRRYTMPTKIPKTTKMNINIDQIAGIRNIRTNHNQFMKMQKIEDLLHKEPKMTDGSGGQTQDL